MLLILLLGLISTELWSQSRPVQSNLSILKRTQNEEIAHCNHHLHSNRDFYLKGAPLRKKLNPFNWFLGGLLYVYQNSLSVQFSADCLYTPSCSDFSKQSLRRYGLFKGLLLTSDRLCRCNRIAETGLHPIRFNHIKKRYNDPPSLYE